ncbi:MAG TPA: L,D-transpeptidase [Solirubrobacter sp.]
MLNRHFAVLGAVAIALIAAAPARAAKIENLQKLGKESYFAYVEKAVPAKKDPKTTAKTVGRLKLKTGEGTDDLVLVLARTTDAKERVWLKVRLPIRPNGTTGWVQENALSELQPVDSWIKVSTKTYKVTVIKAGKKVFSANVGVGQSQWPTPKGQFYIRAKLTNFGDPFYGPLAFVTSATSDTLTDWPGGGIVGIHGTSLPNLIPGKISHGCVRMKNPDILKLDKLVEVGTPITIT